MERWWQFLTRIGASLDLGEIERRRLSVLQWCNLLGVASMVGFLVLFWVVDLSTLAAPFLASLACIPLYGVSWFLNRQGRGEAAKLVFMVVMAGSIFVSTWFLVGKGPGFHFYLLLAAVVPLFFWPLSRPLWIAVFMGLSLAGFLAVNLRTDERGLLVQNFPEAWIPFSSALTIVATYVTVVAVLAFLQHRSEADSQVRESLMRQFEELSNTDPLTGLHNRRSVLRRLEEERGRQSRNGVPFSVILADIDRFKEVNDAWGHEAGDLVLVELSRTLRSQLRDIDTMARWGGEEFLILLPGTDQKGAYRAAEKLRQTAEDARFLYGTTPIRCTLSLGVVVHGPGGDLLDTLRRVDAALYRGKSVGRNRVIGADDGTGFSYS